jgi:hypothetical protein
MRAFLNERSPNRIRWDRHSSLTDRTQRSAKAFKLGLRGGSRRHWPVSSVAAKNYSKAPNLAYVSCCTENVDLGR